MSFKIKEIFDAWIIAQKPTEKQQELAQKRFDICLSCEFYTKSRRRYLSEVCGQCGCPLAKKIFSSKFDACPSHKWTDVENQFFGDQKPASSDTKNII
jgi:hypothetical protein